MKRPRYKEEPQNGDGKVALSDVRSQVEILEAVLRTGNAAAIFPRGVKLLLFALEFAVLLPFMFLVAVSITGCTDSKQPSLGAISVTNPSGSSQGQVTSVIVTASVDVSVAVSSDPDSLGVDWSLLCGGSAVTVSNPNPCGTITPVHVGSNINMAYLAPPYVPIGNTVTLTATATSDPSQSASVTLTIVPQPVQIVFSATYPLPCSSQSSAQQTCGMALGGTWTFGVNVANDPVGAGVNWSCGSSSCGTFTSSGSTSPPAPTLLTGNDFPVLFTAPTAVPSNGSVTITATSVYDGTKSVSTTFPINPISLTPPPTISQNPVTAGLNATLTATVAWDVMSQGVSWAAPQCGASACGSAAAGSCAPVTGGPAGSNSYACTATYIAPPSLPAGAATLPVSETVTSVAGSPPASGTVSFTVGPPPPITVNVTATPSALQSSGTTLLAATVSYDFSDSGVTWTCRPACTLPNSTVPASTTSSTATYTVEYTPTLSILAGAASVPITVTATSIAAPASDPTGSGSTTVTVYQPISVSLTTQPVTAGVPATFSATVNNDIAPGGVDWTATGCLNTNCGTFNSGNPNASNHSASGASITYTAPSNIQWPLTNRTVTITATSTASSSIPPLSSASAQVAVTSVAFAKFVPFAPSTLPVGNPNASPPTLVNLVAAAVNDSTNQGVDWMVSCSDASAAACGQFLESPEMVQTATSADVPASFWPYSAKVHAASGQAIAYEPPTQMPSGGTVTLVATSTANPSATATQVVTITSTLSGPALSGKVMAGSLPVSGATVQLFAAGNTGYGSAATPLVISNGATSVTTASDGTFAIPGGFTCPNLNTLLYLVALGGNPGGPQGPTNPELGLMTALGPCSGLNSSATLFVNEVTTVASIYALQPFTGADYAHIGASSSNYNNGPNPSNATDYNNGLANAFATVNNLADITTGQALLITPAQDGSAPQSEINTLADVVDTCAASAGGVPGDGSACDKYFFYSNNNPPGGGASSVENEPATILQAVLELAQVPSNEIWTEGVSGGPLFNLLPSSDSNLPFTPIQGTAPYDWSIAISYSGGGMEGRVGARPASSSMAIDASGNVWVTNSHSSSVSELSNQGAGLSPFATGTALSDAGGFKGGGLAGPLQIAIDPFGNAWVLNNNSSLSELAPSGAALSPSGGFSGAGNPADTGAGIAIDGSGNIWVADAGTLGDIAEYLGYPGEPPSSPSGTPSPAGTPLSPAGAGYVNGIDSPNGAIAIDGSGNVWTLNQGNTSAVALNGANGTLLDTDVGDQINSVTGYPYNPLCSVFLPQSGNCPGGVPGFGVTMAVDHAGDIYIPDSTAPSTAVIYELAAGGSPSNLGGTGKLFTNGVMPPLSTPIAVDGEGNLWMVYLPSLGYGSFNNFASAPVSVAGFKPSGNSAFNSNGSVPGITAPSLEDATSIATDASGDVWVLGGTNPSTLTEFVGVATPVATPLSVGVQKSKLGSKP